MICGMIDFQSPGAGPYGSTLFYVNHHRVRLQLPQW